MLSTHWSRQVSFLKTELKKYLREGSFANLVWRSLGDELHYRLVEYVDQEEVELTRHDPVTSLLYWARSNGGLHPEWLASGDGEYVDDAGNVIPSSITPSLSDVEQLAAYGLWLIEEELNALGPIPVGDDDDDPAPVYNSDGLRRDDVIEHRASCVILAYHALALAERASRGEEMFAEEAEQLKQVDFSALGRAGARKRHGPMMKLKAWAVEKYRAGNWRSANQAAHALKDQIILHGRTLNAHLSEENAQRTIADWFRKSA